MEILDDVPLASESRGLVILALFVALALLIVVSRGVRIDIGTIIVGAPPKTAAEQPTALPHTAPPVIPAR
jgi:hypothetical protein